MAGGDVQKAAYTDVNDGVLVNSGFMNGMRVAEAKEAIQNYMTEKGFGVRKVNY